MGKRIHEALTCAGIADKAAREWARQIAGRFGKLKSDKKMDKDEDLQIEQLAHFSPEEVEAIEALAKTCAEAGRSPLRRRVAVAAQTARRLTSPCSGECWPTARPLTWRLPCR